MLEDFGTKRIIGRIVRTYTAEDLNGPSFLGNEIKRAILKKFDEQYDEIPDKYTVNIVSEASPYTSMGSENEWRRLIITGYKNEDLL